MRLISAETKVTKTTTTSMKHLVHNTNWWVGFINTEPPGFRNLKFHASTQLSDDQWQTD